MNVDAKILGKILAIKFNSPFKGPYTIIQWDFSYNARMVQYTQVNKHDISY